MQPASSETTQAHARALLCLSPRCSECGVSYVGPTLDAVYGSDCSNDPIASPYPCQYTDPTQLGEEQYPDLLQCDRWLNKCVLDATQVAGDPCTASNECVSGLCVKGVCRGLPVGSKCSPGACAPGVYCHISVNDTGTCRAAIAPGHNCGMLAACGVGYICNLAAPQPTCQQVFSQPNGVVVNTPDLCSTGITDDAGKCTAGLPDASIGTVCDSTAQPPSTAICACARDNTYRLRPHTLRSARMAATRKAARQCFTTAKAPDGTPCRYVHQVYCTGTQLYLHLHVHLPMAPVARGLSSTLLARPSASLCLTA